MRNLLFIWLLAALLLPAFSGSAQRSLSRTEADGRYVQGLELAEKQLYTAALPVFAEYLAAAPKGRYAPDASYYQAFSSLQCSHPDAEKLFLSFVTDYPDSPFRNRAFISLGNYYYAKKAYPQTIEYLSKTDLKHLSAAQKAETQFRLGYAYLSRKEFRKADSLMTLVKSSSHAYTAAANYYSAYLNIRSGKFGTVLPDLDRADKDPAYKPMTPLLRCIVYYKQRKYNQAIKAGEAALKDSSKSGSPDETALLLAESHFALQDYAQAVKYFNFYQKINLAALPPAMQYRRAYAQFKTGETDLALDGFKSVAFRSDTLGLGTGATRDSLKQYAAYYLGVCYVQKDNKPFALPAFEQARKSTANRNVQEQAWFSFGKVNFDLNKFPDAIEAFKTYALRFPDAADEAEANDLLSEAYLNTSDYDQALKHIDGLKKRSKRIDAAYQRVAFLKGTQLYNDNRFSEALAFFEGSLKYPLDSGVTVAAHFWAGECNSVGKKYPEALQQYQALLKKPGFKQNDYYLRTLYGAGYAFYNNKEYDKALPLFEAYTAALAQAENKLYYTDALIRLADCRYAAKDYPAALTAYQQAIDLKVPETDYAYYQKGLVQTLSDKPDEARKTFDWVITAYPSGRYRDEALFQKAQLDFEKGLYEPAASGFTEVLNNATDRNLLSYSYLKRALAYSNLKKYPEAEADFKKILNEYGTYKSANSALLGLQEVLTAAGKTDEFNEYLAKYKTANPDDKSLESVEFETAKNLYFDQKYEKAQKGFEEYLQKYPDNALSPEARFWLAETYFRRSDRPKAEETHKLVLAENKSANITKSLARLGEMALADGRWQEAAGRFRALQAQAKNRKESVNALTGLMEACFMGNKPDSAALMANEILSKPNSGAEALNKASLFLGKVDYANNNLDKALDEFLEVLNSAKDQNGAEAQYLCGEILNKQGKYKESQETLYNLNRNFAAYRKWYDKSFLLIADNYTALNDLYNARYALERLIENSPDKSVKEAAKTKLDALGRKKAG